MYIITKMNHTLLLDSALTGVIIALFSYFMDYCFWENSIFGKWLPFLAKVILSIKDKDKYNLLSKSNNTDESIINEVGQAFFYKILGGCIYCTNVWLNIFYYFFTNSSHLILSLYLLIIQVITAHVILRKLQND